MRRHARRNRRRPAASLQESDSPHPAAPLQPPVPAVAPLVLRDAVALRSAAVGSNLAPLGLRDAVALRSADVGSNLAPLGLRDAVALRSAAVGSNLAPLGLRDAAPGSRCASASPSPRSHRASAPTAPTTPTPRHASPPANLGGQR
ncbi:hypothetical protein [Actinomyces weissii]|uniref:Uncharacterized protein n=1 Tax=Actinomyces weissii TaxID=675090 RepID=A0A7T7M9N0_9ACTO|nr:hypothetical protein [Actinomyces weissii]QQM66947.1 hypothetical protein JG540_07785 [Actinomyces weissii]